MNYTTVTKLARNPKKEFEGAMFKTVLCNNEDIGMVVNKEMSDALKSSGVLKQVIYEYIEKKKQENIQKSYEFMGKDEDYLNEMQENTKYLGNI